MDREHDMTPFDQLMAHLACQENTADYELITIPTSDLIDARLKNVRAVKYTDCDCFITIQIENYHDTGTGHAGMDKALNAGIPKEVVVKCLIAPDIWWEY